MSQHEVTVENNAVLLWNKTHGVHFSTSLGPVKHNLREPIITSNTSTKYAPWGEDNLRPQNLVAIAEKNDLIPSIVDKLAKMLYSDGIAYGYETFDEKTGRKILNRVEIPEIEDYLEEVRFDRYVFEAANEYYLLRNPFVEFRRALKGNIIDVTIRDAVMCRLALQDESDGQIRKVYVNANWHQGGTEDDSEIVDCLLPSYGVAQQIRESKSMKFILPLSTRRNGRVYYDKAPWEGLVDAGWLDLSGAIPLSKKKFMENNLFIKWHVEVPEYWWGWKFKNWDTLTEKEKIKLQQDVLDQFIEFVKGSENSGTVFMSTYKYDRDLNRQFPGWVIKQIGTENKGGEFLADSQEADFHTTRAFGVLPQIIGISPGKGHSAGSGSDIRVAVNQHILFSKPEQDLILSPFTITSSVNDWSTKYKTTLKDKRLKVWFNNYFMATQDEVNKDKRM